MWLKTLYIISEGQHAAWNKLIKCKNERQIESYTNILQDSEKYVHF